MAKHRREKGGEHDRPVRNDTERAMRDASPGASRQQGDGYKASDRAGAQEPSRERKDSRRRQGNEDLEERLADEPERREGMSSGAEEDHPNFGRERSGRQPDNPSETEERDHDLH